MLGYSRWCGTTIRWGFAIVLSCTVSLTALSAHDTWVQTNAALLRTGDAIHIDLMLGNHGNEHRDFKLASKLDPAGCTLTVRSPSGKVYDVKDKLVDLGLAPKEGFWSTRFAAKESGMYIVEHTLDRVLNHGKLVRSIKSGKALYMMTPLLDKVPEDAPGFNHVCGHALELVPQVNPVAPMGPGKPIKVQLLWKGKPLAKTKISFVPRGYTLAEGFDKDYERETDEAGMASFTPTEGNYYLIVAHVNAPDEKTADYVMTQYSATLTVLVPDVCPCCGD